MAEDAQQRPGRAAATQQDVADAVGVSRGLVSMALSGRGRMAPGTRLRIVSAARDLGYHLNTAAAELASRQSRRVAVIVPYLDNPYFDLLVRALRHEASRCGLLLVSFVSDLTDRIERETVDDVLSMRPRGLILPGTTLPESDLRTIADDVRLCVIDRSLEDPTIDLVRMDEDGAAAQIVGHLAARGARTLVFLAPADQLTEPLITERREACRRAAASSGLDFEWAACDDGVSSVLHGVLERRAERIGAVAYNDVLGLDLLAAVLGSGLVPGRDVIAVSYDNSPLARRGEIALTSVDQSPEALAAAAVEAILRDDGDPVVRRTVPARLVVRRSSTGPRG